MNGAREEKKRKINGRTISEEKAIANVHILPGGGNHREKKGQDQRQGRFRTHPERVRKDHGKRVMGRTIGVNARQRHLAS